MLEKPQVMFVYFSDKGFDYVTHHLMLPLSEDSINQELSYKSIKAKNYINAVTNPIRCYVNHDYLEMIFPFEIENNLARDLRVKNNGNKILAMIYIFMLKKHEKRFIQAKEELRKIVNQWKQNYSDIVEINEFAIMQLEKQILEEYSKSRYDTLNSKKEVEDFKEPSETTMEIKDLSFYPVKYSCYVPQFYDLQLKGIFDYFSKFNDY